MNADLYTAEYRCRETLYVYVMSKRQAEHSKSLGMGVVPPVKAFIGRTPRGYETARRNARKFLVKN